MLLTLDRHWVAEESVLSCTELAERVRLTQRINYKQALYVE